MHWKNFLRRKHRYSLSCLHRLKVLAAVEPALMVRLLLSGLLAFLLAQTTAYAQAPAPCPYGAANLAEHPAAPANLSIQSELSWQLATQWIEADHADTLLAVLGQLTASSNPFTSGADEVNRHALADLEHLTPANTPLYEAAMGDPDALGRPSVAPPASLLDALAKANLLNPPTDDNAKLAYESDLFTCTTEIVARLYPAHAGGAKPGIVQIDSEFQNGGGSNYVALFQLLSAYREFLVPNDHDWADMEFLRAAFKDSPTRLAKIVHLRVISAQN